MQDKNFMYIEAFMCVSCVQEERRWTHGPRGRLLAKSSHAPSFTTKARNAAFLYLPVQILHMKLKNITKSGWYLVNFMWNIKNTTLHFNTPQKSEVCCFRILCQGVNYVYWVLCTAPKVKSLTNTLLLKLLFVEKDIGFNFHMLVSLDRVDKHKMSECSVQTHIHRQRDTQILAIECKLNHRSRQYLCQTLWPWRIDIGRFVEPWQQSSVNLTDETRAFVLYRNWSVNSSHFCSAKSS